MFPLFWLIKISVTPDRLLFTEGVALWPSRMTWENFEFVLLQSDFPAFFANSVMVSLGTAAIVTVMAAAAGYAFSRFRFRGRYHRRLHHAADPDVPAGDADRADLPADDAVGADRQPGRADHRLHRLQRAVRHLPDAVLLRRHPQGAGGGGDDRRLHPPHRPAPGDLPADPARHGGDAGLRLHRRLERAAVRPDADQQRGAA